MKLHTIFKFTLTPILALSLIFTLSAQTVTKEKLIGCWKIKSVSFLQKMEDSLAFIKSTKGMITCFEDKGKFTTKLKTENSIQIIGTGTFNLSADGKTINQKRDAGDDDAVDEPGEVSMPGEQTLIFKVDQIILNFERTPDK